MENLGLAAFSVWAQKYKGRVWSPPLQNHAFAWGVFSDFWYL